MLTPEVHAAGLRRERMFQSPRFADGRFHNTPGLDGSGHKSGSMLSASSEYFFGNRSVARRPPAAIPTERPLEAWLRPCETGLRATWLGHSTTLLEIDGARVLTDPVWSDRISPVPLVGPRRFDAVPVAIGELPKLDAVLVSHDHYDHLDLPTVRELARLDVPFVTSLGVGARLEAEGIRPERIVELDWWESAVVGGVSFTATPARHFSGRSVFDRNRTLWSSWVIGGDRHRVFFSGDTGLTPEFRSIKERYGPFDLVMLEIGAFHEAWGDIHLGPDNALVAFDMLGGGTLLPVHWGTFDLALHAWDDPAERLVARAVSLHVVTPRLGRAIEPSRVASVDPWWREVVRVGADARLKAGVTASTPALDGRGPT